MHSSRSLKYLLLSALVACGGSDNSNTPHTDSATTYIIAGLVTGGPDLTKVTISLNPGGTTVHPHSNGEYRFEGLADGTYTVSPSLSGYIFNPASLSLTVDGLDLSNQNFVMNSVSGSSANTPAIPLPRSAADELPGKSEDLVTDVALLKDFSPYVDSPAFLSICPSFKNGTVVLVSNGVDVTPSVPSSYSCNPHDCDCNWFGYDCDTCYDTCAGTCSGPLVVNSPCLRRTVYWQKLFQTLVGPGASYSQAWSVTNGSSNTDSQTLATSMSVSARAGLDLFKVLSLSITETFSHSTSNTHSVTISESQTVSQTFSCPAGADNSSRLFAVWQLHERFDFSDETGKVAWSDPVYLPTSEPSLPALDNALSLYYESTTRF